MTALRHFFYRSDPKDIAGLRDARVRLARSTVVANDLKGEERKNGFGQIFQDALTPRRHRRG